MLDTPNVGLNIKGLDKPSMPRSGDVGVSRDTTLVQTKELITVGYSPTSGTPDTSARAPGQVLKLLPLLTGESTSRGPNVELPNVTDAAALMRAYGDEFIRPDCPPECPLLNSALDRECLGDIAGAMSALKRHRSSRCRWPIR